MKVIDVSYHQGAIDWKLVKSDGVEGVIIRAGYGVRTVDKRFKEYIEKAIAEGLHIGVYWFMYGKDDVDAVVNAHKCIHTISEYKDHIDLGVWSDWEYDSDENAPGQTKTSRTEFVVLFNSTIEAAGFKAGTYLNLDYYRYKFNMKQLEKWDIWLADYSGECDYPCLMRQYTSKGSIKGIKGNVDMDEYFGTVSKSEFNGDDTVKINLAVLKKGSEGDQVKTVQRILFCLGYKGKDGKSLGIDGDLGTNTDYAIRNFQSAKGLDADGIMGPKTWEHLLK